MLTFKPFDIAYLHIISNWVFKGQLKKITSKHLICNHCIAFISIQLNTCIYNYISKLFLILCDCMQFRIAITWPWLYEVLWLIWKLKLNRAVSILQRDFVRQKHCSDKAIKLKEIVVILKLISCLCMDKLKYNLSRVYTVLKWK